MLFSYASSLCLIRKNLAAFLHNQIWHNRHSSDYKVCDTITKDYCWLRWLNIKFMHPFSINRMCISLIRWEKTQHRKSFVIHRRSHIFYMNQSHIEDFIGKLYIHSRILVAFAMKKILTKWFFSLRLSTPKSFWTRNCTCSQHDGKMFQFTRVMRNRCFI